MTIHQSRGTVRIIVGKALTWPADAAMLFAAIIFITGGVTIAGYTFGFVKDILYLTLGLSLLAWAVGGRDVVRATFTFRALTAVYDRLTAVYSRRPVALVGAFAAIYAALWTAIAALRYVNWRVDIFDVSVFYQELWNTLHGHFYATCLMPSSFVFADHVDPLNLVFLPLVWLFGSPLALMIAQNIILTASALVLLLLVRQKTDYAGYQWVIPFLYLAYMPLHSIMKFDYHPIALSIPLLFAALYFFERKRFGWFWVLAILGLACKETVWPGLACFGFALALRKGPSRKQGLAILIASAAVGVLELGYLPSLSGAHGHALDYFDGLGGSWREIAASIVSNPRAMAGKIFQPKLLDFIWQVGSPVWFLPLFSLATALPLAAFLAMYSLASSGVELSYAGHHVSEFIPYLFYGLLCTLPRLEQLLEVRFGAKRRTLQRVLAMALLATAFLQYARSETFYLRESRDLTHPDAPLVRNLIDQYVPPTAGVAVNACMLPHVLNRRCAADLKRLPRSVEQIDYVVYHRTMCPTHWPKIRPGEIEDFMRRQPFAPIYQDGKVTIYRRQ
jgi:uncharacterized membrane protein